MKKYPLKSSGIIIIAVFTLMAIASTPQKQIATNTNYNVNTMLHPEKDEKLEKAEKLAFLKNSKNPTIVLRVPNTVSSVVSDNKSMQGSTNIYNAIEKELFRAGFVVRDRALFEQVLDKNYGRDISTGKVDYSKINELTETDLILELSGFEYIPYHQKQFNYTITSGKKKKQKTTDYTLNCSNELTLYGLKMEFRLIKVKDNDLVGDYTFNYAPCSNENCYYVINVLNNPATGVINSCTSITDPAQNRVLVGPTDFIPNDKLQEFVKKSTQQLIHGIIK